MGALQTTTALALREHLAPHHRVGAPPQRLSEIPAVRRARTRIPRTLTHPLSRKTPRAPGAVDTDEELSESEEPDEGAGSPATPTETKEPKDPKEAASEDPAIPDEPEQVMKRPASPEESRSAKTARIAGGGVVLREMALLSDFRHNNTAVLVDLETHPPPAFAVRNILSNSSKAALVYVVNSEYPDYCDLVADDGMDDEDEESPLECRFEQLEEWIGTVVHKSEAYEDAWSQTRQAPRIFITRL